MNKSENFYNISYLALELAKLKVKKEHTKEYIIELYTYFFHSLSGIENNLSLATELEKTKLELSKVYKELNEYQNSKHPLLDSIIEFVNSAKGDMEPYVYNTIINMLTR